MPQPLETLLPTGAEVIPKLRGEPNPFLGGTETIMLVEDEPSLRYVTATILKRCGYQLVLAASGAEALAAWADQKSTVRLLLTDVLMPDGISGRDLAQRLRTENQALPVILTSGYSVEDSEPESTPLAGARFLQKPYSIGDLTRTIRDCLDHS